MNSKELITGSGADVIKIEDINRYKNIVRGLGIVRLRKARSDLGLCRCCAFRDVCNTSYKKNKCKWMRMALNGISPSIPANKREPTYRHAQKCHSEEKRIV